MILSSQVQISKENVPKHPEGTKVTEVQLKNHISFHRRVGGFYCLVKFCF